MTGDWPVKAYRNRAFIDRVDARPLRILAEYLEPYRPQRGRVPALVAAGGLHRPRHGPRMAPRTHLPGRIR